MGRSSSLPTLPTVPSKKPREGVVPPGTGKPFIFSASLLTDSCVDWKVGYMLYGLDSTSHVGYQSLTCPHLFGPPTPQQPQVQMHH